MRTLFNEMNKFSDLTSFRQIYKKFLYINCKELLDVMLPGEVKAEITGIFAYCYIDQAEGLSFRPFALASMTDDQIQIFDLPHQEDTIFVLRLRDCEERMSELHEKGMHLYLYAVNPSKYSYIDLSEVNFDTETYSDFKNMVDKNYYVSDMVERLRTEEFSCLDNYRNTLYPDDVRVLLYSEENGIEQVWVRLTFITKNNELFGELLNEPYKDYGCHEGMLIEVEEVNVGDGKALLFTGRMAQIQGE